MTEVQKRDLKVTVHGARYEDYTGMGESFALYCQWNREGDDGSEVREELIQIGELRTPTTFGAPYEEILIPHQRNRLVVLGFEGAPHKAQVIVERRAERGERSARITVPLATFLATTIRTTKDWLTDDYALDVGHGILPEGFERAEPNTEARAHWLETGDLSKGAPWAIFVRR